ncbi:unnamed protein product [Acanthoscelides obtectus]|uniref:Transcriptional adapter n=2 Tax=Acanthoscelides obtectus TaxID=200917 RepID=A0A9P0LXK7_ACAOB|nr:unnamed protein product [Acanthoscelides obtectus]CAK1659152.1 Transcriptional adapter 2-alpha [Acanthoscelides obtectus]
MANTNTDLTEEDAADLQFPKEDDLSKSSLSCVPANTFLDNPDSSYCVNCYSEVTNQYILCNKCDTVICLACFSNGAEFGEHKSNHDYRILSTKFVLFKNSDWTAEEEMKLLDAILNYGNWNLVSQEFPNRSLSEIIDHYDHFYLDGNGSKAMPKMMRRDSAGFKQVVVPYRLRIADSEEPPRYLPNTIGHECLAGYNPARSDFENDYDKNAEDMIAHLEYVGEDDPHYEMLTKLQCAIIESYNRRLRERQRWKNIISKHGLLQTRKMMAWFQRYKNTIEKNVCEKMVRFLQLCEPMRFDMLMEGLHKEGELKLQMSRLMYLRRKGITTLAEGRLFLKLQQVRSEHRKSLKAFRSNNIFNWKQSRESAVDISTGLKQRKQVFTPIEILGMPGYCRLNEKERELCRNVRLVPNAYLHLKEILVSEFSRSGSVKLQTARRLLKIDVNKTRKLYDFMIEEGYITKH